MSFDLEIVPAVFAGDRSDDVSMFNAFQPK